MGVARENVICIVRQKSLIPTCVNVTDSQLLNTGGSTVLVLAHEAGNIMSANLEDSDLSFFISRSWRCDSPPQEGRIGGLVQKINVKDVFGAARTRVPCRVVSIAEW